MVICGQEFNFSVLNANDMDRFEDAYERMQQAGRAEEERFNRGGVRLGDHMRAQARLVMACIDEILGAGASARLGLDENDAAPIYDVLDAINEACMAEKQRYTSRIPKTQPVNREQRRAQKKAQQRTQTAGRIVTTDKVIRMAPKVTIRENPADAALRLADARIAMDSLRDDPEAMQQLADYALSLAAGRHV